MVENARMEERAMGAARGAKALARGAATRRDRAIEAIVNMRGGLVRGGLDEICRVGDISQVLSQSSARKQPNGTALRRTWAERQVFGG